MPLNTNQEDVGSSPAVSTKTCSKCKSAHAKAGAFCSRRCANGRQHSAETKLKQSVAVAKFWKENPGSLRSLSGNAWREVYGRSVHRRRQSPRCCTGCGVEFTPLAHCASGGYVTTCSDECFISVKRRNSRGDKSIRYGGIALDSRWELEIAEFLDSIGIEWTRPAPVQWFDATGKSRKYFADFFLPAYGVYLDPKNRFAIKQQEEKLAAMVGRIQLVYGSVDIIKAAVSRLEGAA